MWAAESISSNVQVTNYGFFFAYPLNQTDPDSDLDESIGYNETLPNQGAPTMKDNAIYNIFRAPPNKTEALAYLDNAGPKPDRYANVIVIRGAETVPDVMEYKASSIIMQMLKLIHDRLQILVQNERQVLQFKLFAARTCLY